MGYACKFACDSSCLQLLNVYRPKEGTRLERLENQTSGLSPLENEITGNEESSSEPGSVGSGVSFHSTMFKIRCSNMYHTVENVRIRMTGLCITCSFFSLIMNAPSPFWIPHSFWPSQTSSRNLQRQEHPLPMTPSALRVFCQRLRPSPPTFLPVGP
jgi:hypothetical protein